MKKSKKNIIFAVIMIVIVMSFTLLTSCGVSEGQVKKMLEDDLGSSVTISEIYYKEAYPACLVRFQSGSSSDIAGIDMDSGKIEYESNATYYSLMYEYSYSNYEKSMYASKLLDNENVISWKLDFALNGTSEEGGWKQIK